eukprot:178794_1
MVNKLDVEHFELLIHRSKMSFLLCSFLFIHCSYTQHVDQQWSVDISSPGSSRFEFWFNKCVGSGHGSLALRSDWQKMLKYVHNEIGFSSVRFHGILNDDVGTYNGPGQYSFINTDKIFDFLLSINMKPYIEVSFTPNALASGPCFIDHYKLNSTPPKDYNEWQKYITAWVQHCVDRYGIDTISQWTFEIWNEPNIAFFQQYINGTCQDSTFDDYILLYNKTVTAIKSVNKQIKVGGPSTAGLGWIDQFLQTNLPIDFVSSHSYPPPGNNISINNNQWVQHLMSINEKLEKYNKNYPGIPFYLSEFNSGLMYYHLDPPPPNTQYIDNQDSLYAASFMICQMDKMQKLFAAQNNHYKALSYWTFSDIFEEQGFKSHEFWPNYTYSVGGDVHFGMTTIRGINKPVFNVFRNVYKYGSDTQFNAQLINGDKDVNNNTVSLFVLKNNNNGSKNRYSLFMTNFAAYPYPIKLFQNQTVSVYVTQNIDPSLMVPKSAILYMMNKNNGNAYQTWIKMGKPEYPTLQQMKELNESSQIMPSNISWIVINDSTVRFDVSVAKYVVVFIDIQY